LIRTCGKGKDFLPEDCQKNFLTNWKKLEKANIELFSAKVSNDQYDRKQCRRRPTVPGLFLLLPGSVEKQLGQRYICFVTSLLSIIFIIIIIFYSPAQHETNMNNNN